MTEYDYEAEIETEYGTFTFRGDDCKTVSAQAARMPVMMHQNQVTRGVNLSRDIGEYMEYIAKKKEKIEKKKNGFKRRYSRD